MNRLYKITPLLVVLCGFAAAGRATVLLDDTWIDGTRTDTGLPADSAWYASTGSALVAATNAMTLSMGGSAILGITVLHGQRHQPHAIGGG